MTGWKRSLVLAFTLTLGACQSDFQIDPDLDSRQDAGTQVNKVTTVDGAVGAAGAGAGGDSGPVELCPASACDDDIDCTTDSCDPETGDCIHSSDGCQCDQMQDCVPQTGARACDAYACNDGVCQSDDSACCKSDSDCDDSDPCTVDTCNTTTGACTNATETCDDGIACTVDSCDTTGMCVNDPTACECQEDTDCVPQAGARACEVYGCEKFACTTDDAACCQNDGDCSDGDACTNDSCNVSTGECGHSARVCDDGRSCSTDSCDPASGCVFEGCGCDSDDDCPDFSDCVVGVCDIDTGNCSDQPNAGGVCADGDTCTGTDVCRADAVCAGRFDVCDAIPPAWICRLSWYGDGSCDCGCGALDIDCDDATIASCEYCTMCSTGSPTNCSTSNLASSTTCKPAPPAGWICAATLYGDGSCTCGCGVVDSDCDDATRAACDTCSSVSGLSYPRRCSDGLDCSAVKLTNNADCGAGPTPNAWSCPIAAYGGGDGCDCGCGALDPDCSDGSPASCDDCSVCGGCGNVAAISNAFCQSNP